MRAVAAENELSQRGFARWDLAQHFDLNESDANLASLATEFDDLPADPYATHAGRYRRYARGLILPWTRAFSWMPAGHDENGADIDPYYQGDNNPEFPGWTRMLPAISAQARENPLLLDLIAFDFAQTSWDAADVIWPVYVGVHLVKLAVTGVHEKAVSSPDSLHQDGETFVFSHLIYRRNACGGRNVIATPECRDMHPEDAPPDLLLAEFQLAGPLETYGVRDTMVSHYVAPVTRASDSRPGERAVIIVDFVPMRHSI